MKNLPPVVILIGYSETESITQEFSGGIIFMTDTLSELDSLKHELSLLRPLTRGELERVRKRAIH